jgi:lysophospholipase L1-like esterase
MGTLPTYKPRHLIDFYRFYRVNPEYRSDHVRTNSAGFRNDYEVAPDKPADVLRVVLMGGSTVWGEDAGPPLTGIIDNRDTIAAHLETALTALPSVNATWRRVEVLNAGVVGYRLFQDLNYFNHVVAAFHPDVVVAIDGHNDLDALWLGLPPYRHANEILFDQSINHPTFFDLVRWGIKYAEGRSLFVRKTNYLLTQVINNRALESQVRALSGRSVTPAELSKWLHDYETTVRRLDASVRIAGGRALFAVQPEILAERHKRLSPEEEKIRAYWAPKYTWLHSVPRSQLIAYLEASAIAHGFRFTDISDVFAGSNGTVYLDYTHLTSEGARLLALRLVKEIEPLLPRGVSSQPR